MDLPIHDIFIIAFMLAAVAVLQFFKGRKLNLMLIKYTAEKFEEVLKPKDKEYQLIGLYVGYKAKFEVQCKSLKKVEAVVTLIPRQSLLYFPIAMLTSRFDKVYLFFRYGRSFSGEAHIIRKHYYRLGLRRVISGIERMRVKEEEIGGKMFYLVYNDAALMNKLIKFIKRLNTPHIVNHVAIVPSNKSVFISAKISLKSFEELLSKIYSFACSLA